ncbi:hypothetical protein JXB02_05560 [Candidatus Woesearchaeota archaeon]|nr:hypothetical protein [Candidatus Woesearchaeota archaeon]
MMKGTTEGTVARNVLETIATELADAYEGKRPVIIYTNVMPNFIADPGAGSGDYAGFNPIATTPTNHLVATDSIGLVPAMKRTFRQRFADLFSAEPVMVLSFTQTINPASVGLAVHDEHAYLAARRHFTGFLRALYTDRLLEPFADGFHIRNGDLEERMREQLSIVANALDTRGLDPYDIGESAVDAAIGRVTDLVLRNGRTTAATVRVVRLADAPDDYRVIPMYATQEDASPVLSGVMTAIRDYKKHGRYPKTPNVSVTPYQQTFPNPFGDTNDSNVFKGWGR